MEIEVNINSVVNDIFYKYHQSAPHILCDLPKENAESLLSAWRLLSAVLLCEDIRPELPAVTLHTSGNIPEAVLHGADPVAPHQLFRFGAVPGLDRPKDLAVLGYGDLPHPVTVEVVVFDPLDVENHRAGKFLHIQWQKQGILKRKKAQA